MSNNTGSPVDFEETTGIAHQDMVDFLLSKEGPRAADAYARSSLAVDSGIGEVVGIVNLVCVRIPEKIFQPNPPYWFKPPGESDA